MNAIEQSIAKLETWMSLQRKYKKTDAAQMAFFRDLHIAITHLQNYNQMMKQKQQQ